MINPSETELHSDQFENDVNPEYVPPERLQFHIKMPALKIIPLAITVILVLVFAALALSLSNNPNNSVVVVNSPTPQASVFKTPSPTNPPSIFATDAGLIEVKNKIEENLNYTNTVDLSESNLSFPILDFDIDFEK